MSRIYALNKESKETTYEFFVHIPFNKTFVSLSMALSFWYPALSLCYHLI
jgi:hypothetical protein